MNYKEQYLNTTIGTVFSLYVNNDKTALITFLHGAGDSHLNYISFLNNPLLCAYDIFIPDMIGYGKSHRAKSSFSFTQQKAFMPLKQQSHNMVHLFLKRYTNFLKIMAIYQHGFTTGAIKSTQLDWKNPHYKFSTPN